MFYYLSFGGSGRVTGVHLQSKAAGTTTACVEVPLQWAMYTTKGNARIETLACDFVTNLAKKLAPQVAVRRFFQKFARLCKTRTMGEASDTAVRESVLSFARKFADLTGHEYLETAWDQEVG
jgi:hypothetical protein